MGQPIPDKNDKRFFYIDLTTVKKEIIAHPTICEANNSSDFIKKIMRSEVLKKFTYQENEFNQNDFEELDIYQEICQKDMNRLNK